MDFKRKGKPMKGFTLVELFLAIFMIFIIGLIGYNIYTGGGIDIGKWDKDSTIILILLVILIFK
jgi:hypothetical protein